MNNIANISYNQAYITHITKININKKNKNMVYNRIREGVSMFKKLANKININQRRSNTGAAINPLEVDFDNKQKEFFKSLTNSALNMYQKKCDIKKFTKLALSDLDNTSENEIVNELMQKGIIDPYEDEKLSDLANNKRFLRDLGLE